MTAATMPGLVICLSETFNLRRISKCPTCKCRRRIAGVDRGLWYGIIWTCCACGDSWGDGEMLERPFRRGWRKEAIADARETWVSASPASEHRAWIRLQMEDYCQVSETVAARVEPVGGTP